jgi:hypothetical protein
LMIFPSLSIYSPYHLSTLLSFYPSILNWKSSVILPILLLLTLGMTKTISHLFQSHLYPLYKCIRQSLLMKHKALNGTFPWWLRVMSMNTNYC